MWPNLQEIADLVTFTEEIHKRKLHFFCAVLVGLHLQLTSTASVAKMYRTFNGYSSRSYITGPEGAFPKVFCKNRPETLKKKLWRGCFLLKFYKTNFSERQQLWMVFFTGLKISENFKGNAFSAELIFRYSLRLTISYE